MPESESESESESEADSYSICSSSSESTLVSYKSCKESTCSESENTMPNDGNLGEDIYSVEKIVNFEPNFKNTKEAYFEIKWTGYKK